jgi:hypothetical protein
VLCVDAAAATLDGLGELLTWWNFWVRVDATP